MANGATSASSTALTIGAVSNPALVVALGLSSTTITSLTVTWDSGASNQAAASIVAANSTQPTRSVLFGLVGPVSGAKTCKAAWTGTSDCIMNGTSFAGVDQTGGATSFPHSNSATGTSNSASVVITSATGNFTISTASEDASSWSSVANTQTFLNNTGTNVSAAGERAAGAATVTHTYTTTVLPPWVVVGCDILAAAAASGDTQEWRGPIQVPRRLDGNLSY